MKNCFGYVRVSTQKQGEGVSLEAQKEAISEFALRNDLFICRWFEEKVTAAKSGRPVFGAMVKELIRGGAQGLVVHKIDRSARNFADWAKVGDLSDAGVDVHFASETLDFRSRGGRLSADIQAVIAADYIRNLREETLKGMRGRLKQGFCPWGAPLGYRNHGGGKVKTLDPLLAPHLRRLFELYASGRHSLWSLVSEMRQSGFRTPAGRTLSKHAIEAILSNPFYCGVLKVRSTGETFPGKHEALISVSLFRAVQELKAGKAGKKVTRHSFAFRGLFRCALCRHGITPERQKGHVYYRCHTPSCGTKSVREEVIEQAIAQLFATFGFDRETTEAFEGWVAGVFGEEAIREERRSVAVRLTQTDERLSRLTDAFIDRHIDERTFASRKEALLLDRRRLEEQASATTGVTAERAVKFFELVNTVAAAYDSAELPDKRQIIRLATSNRTLSGRNVVLGPSEWLVPVQKSTTVGSGDPTRPTFRMPKEHVEQLIAASQSPGAVELQALLESQQAITNPPPSANDTRFKPKPAAKHRRLQVGL